MHLFGKPEVRQLPRSQRLLQISAIVWTVVAGTVALAVYWQMTHPERSTSRSSLLWSHGNGKANVATDDGILETVPTKPLPSVTAEPQSPAVQRLLRYLKRTNYHADIHQAVFIIGEECGGDAASWNSDVDAASWNSDVDAASWNSDVDDSDHDAAVTSFNTDEASEGRGSDDNVDTHIACRMFTVPRLPVTRANNSSPPMATFHTYPLSRPVRFVVECTSALANGLSLMTPAGALPLELVSARSSSKIVVYTHMDDLPAPSTPGVLMLSISSASQGYHQLTYATLSVKSACASYANETTSDIPSQSPFIGTWQHGTGLRHDKIRWCGAQCYHTEFDDEIALSTTFNRQLLANASLIFMGNSHIRNLFRCTADLVSLGASLTSTDYPCPAPTTATSKDNATTATTTANYTLASQSRMNDVGFRHCLSCLNMSPIHRADYKYRAEELGMNLNKYWTLIWDASGRERQACNATGVTGDPKNMRCIAQRHLGGNVNAREYTGNRIGMDFLHKHVLPRMAADPRAHLVINLYMHYNELVYMDHLAEVFRRTHIMDRVTVVVDPSRVTQDAEMAVARLRLAGVGVLDLRPVFRRYVEQWERGEVGGADNEAEPMFHGHLGGGLQRVLVNHLLTHVALKAATGSRRDIGDIPNALEPSVCR